jgi:hypothetical protein
MGVEDILEYFQEAQITSYRTTLYTQSIQSFVLFLNDLYEVIGFLPSAMFSRHLYL